MLFPIKIPQIAPMLNLKKNCAPPPLCFMSSWIDLATPVPPTSPNVQVMDYPKVEQLMQSNLDSPCVFPKPCNLGWLYRGVTFQGETWNIGCNTRCNSRWLYNFFYYVKKIKHHFYKKKLHLYEEIFEAKCEHLDWIFHFMQGLCCLLL
jgi:hypothetical protein